MMHRFVAVTISFIILMGCNSAANKDQAGVPADSESEVIKIVPASSPEELIESFKRVFSSGKKEMLEQLVFWEGVPEDQRDLTLTYRLTAGLVADAKITEARLIPPEEHNEQSHSYSLTPTHSLKYRYESNSGNWSGGTSTEIGQVDGRYYFAAVILKNG